MKRAAAMLVSGHNQTAAFEARARERLAVALSSASPGNDSTVDATTHAALISVVTAAFFTLSVQAALTFQKCRFDRGLLVGTTMAAVNWYEDFARRKSFRPSRWTAILIATLTTAFTIVLQQAAHAWAATLPQTITHS